MTEPRQSELTLGERRYLKRVCEAQSEGVSLKDYYLAHGLSLRMLSRVRRQLSDKGMVPSPSSAVAKASEAGKLIELRVNDSAGSAGFPAAGPVCRLRHPGRWLIKCGLWPDPIWLSGLMNAGTYASVRPRSVPGSIRSVMPLINLMNDGLLARAPISFVLLRQPLPMALSPPRT